MKRTENVWAGGVQSTCHGGGGWGEHSMMGEGPPFSSPMVAKLGKGKNPDKR